MVIFNSEEDLLFTLDKHDQLVRNCVKGKITFQQFLDEYNDFYAFYALDGHESDLEERELLEKYENRIEPHFEILEILGGLCSDEDAEKDSYIQAGRFGSQAAFDRIKKIAETYTTR